ncbi:hypothetical protein [Roseicella aquatilis]|uniref:Uncharacterized protein n=1 Tax=Roseicella aquatilis TaxID=2527868 RepID=A0A4R4D545_9PROT|nr:hypothetical protein [Roseicella aquatilis]TCZ53890.1 hypothetical protein EXY23_24085 [Roseicella aquatilis]
MSRRLAGPTSAAPPRPPGRPQRGTPPPAPRARLRRPAEATAAAVPPLPQPDWIGNRLRVSGPAERVAALQAAAAGAGVVPWRHDDGAAEARWLGLLLAAAGPPGATGRAAEARAIAADLRAAWLADQAAAAARVGRARDCPFDLHALLPVPAAVLALGPDDPAARRWLWETWGTPWPLRRVRLLEQRQEGDAAMLVYGFVSADWSPWQALLRLRARWPALRLELRPSYG